MGFLFPGMILIKKSHITIKLHEKNKYSGSLLYVTIITMTLKMATHKCFTLFKVIICENHANQGTFIVLSSPYLIIYLNSIV